MTRPGWLLASLGWAVLLGLRAVWPGEDGRLWELVAEARFSGLGWSFARGALWLTVLAGAPWVVLGGLCRLAAGGLHGRSADFFGSLIGLALAWVLAWVVEGFDGAGRWRIPATFELLVPGAACLAGVVLGGAFLARRVSVLSSLIGRSALLAAAAGFAVLAVATAVLAGSVPDAPRASITSDQKRSLVGELRRHNPLELVDGQRGGLAFAPEEIQALLAWGALLVDDDARVAVQERGDALGWLASVRLPVGLGTRRQLTLQGELALASGPAGLVVARCGLAAGALEVAPWLCRSIAHSLYRLTRGSADFGALAAAVESLRIDDAGLVASYVRPDVDLLARRRLQLAFGPGREIRAAVRAQFELLRRRGPELAREDDRFAAVLRAAFELARQRSADGNPVAQNQGAILALATILGHQDVASLAGIERPADWHEIRRELWPVALRGRDDWARHFLVSAGLTQISTAVVSDAAGLLKEELDAAQRSGFSFADLLADRAGTRFGELAIRDESTARALQAALVERMRLDDLMPPGDDLPEGIADADLQRRYGGVGGPGYQALVAEIEARVDRLPAF